MQFVTETLATALDLDRLVILEYKPIEKIILTNFIFYLTNLKNSHAIEVPIGHPDENYEILDDISYRKGAAVICMLHNYIGDDVNNFFKIII